MLLHGQCSASQQSLGWIKFETIPEPHTEVKHPNTLSLCDSPVLARPYTDERHEEELRKQSSCEQYKLMRAKDYGEGPEVVRGCRKATQAWPFLLP